MLLSPVTSGAACELFADSFSAAAVAAAAAAAASFAAADALASAPTEEICVGGKEGLERGERHLGDLERRVRVEVERELRLALVEGARQR